MSWIDKIKNDLIITTGEGSVFKPSWINATKLVEYNVSEFEFPELKGTKVDKRTPLGRKFSLEIYFQGENHLDIAKDFEIACEDKRPWTVEHPLYDTLIVQPMSLLFDNSVMNITKITGTIIETIIDDNPKLSASPIDTIKVLKLSSDEILEAKLNALILPTDINDMTLTAKKNYNFTVPIITLPNEAQTYTNLFNTAIGAINTATATPLLAMRAIISMITAPALFSISVKNRVNLLANQFISFRQNINGITRTSTKQIYQATAGTYISTMCYAASTPLDNDYSNTRKTNDILDFIIKNYNQYLEDLDLLQSQNGGNTSSFIPDAEALNNLASLVYTTIANLLSILISGKQERKIILEHDSNLIVLTHRLYGLDPDDINMLELIENNNWGLNEIFQIRKGTEVIYYL